MRRVRLTDAGRDRLDDELDASRRRRQRPSAPSERDAREDGAAQALSALHLYRRDQHYVVVDGKVQIVDESTGRVCPTAPGSAACTR